MAFENLGSVNVLVGALQPIPPIKISAPEADDTPLGLGASDLGLGALRSAYEDVAKSQTDQGALIQQAKAALRNQRAPSLLGALGTGLSQPKTQPGIMGALANINSGLSAYDTAKAAYDQAQSDTALKYGLKQAELQGESAKTRGEQALSLGTLEEKRAERERLNNAVTHTDVEVNGQTVRTYFDRNGKKVSQEIIGEPRKADETLHGILGFYNDKNIWTPYAEYAQPGKPKELPQGVLNRKTVLIGDAGLFARTAAEAERLAGLITQGTLKLGPLENVASIAKGLAGRSDDNAVNYADLQRFVNESVNAVLNTAKGVQARDDAIRAKKQILQHLNDPKIVVSGLRDLNKMMLDNVSTRDAEIASIYRNYNTEPLTVWDELGIDAPANYNAPKRPSANGPPAAKNPPARPPPPAAGNPPARPPPPAAKGPPAPAPLPQSALDVANKILRARRAAEAQNTGEK